MYVAWYISIEDEEMKDKQSRPDMTAFSPPNAPSHK